MLFTGTAPLYLMSTTYVLVGALLGCPMGGEFKAALQAAWQVQTFQTAPCMRIAKRQHCWLPVGKATWRHLVNIISLWAL